MQEDIEVIGTAAGGEEALSLLLENAVDVVLVDLRMPGASGIETLKKIREQSTRSRSIVLSSFEYDEEIYDPLRPERKATFTKSRVVKTF